MGRTEYWNDPQAPKPNGPVPICALLATDDQGRILLQRRRDTGRADTGRFRHREDDVVPQLMAAPGLPMPRW
jgi:hypothetical protein